MASVSDICPSSSLASLTRAKRNEEQGCYSSKFSHCFLKQLGVDQRAGLMAAFNRGGGLKDINEGVESQVKAGLA